jgi:hypothetical protein
MQHRISASALTATALAGALLAVAPASAQPPPSPPPPPCTPAANVVCEQQGPEDLVMLGQDWVVASAIAGTGGVATIRVSDRTPMTIYPAAGARNRHDTATYPDCPGPPDTSNFTTHGLYVEPGGGPVYKLFVVAHGARESIEIFEVDTAGSTPVATWIGCAIAPDPIGLNSVRGLPDGGFITTNFLPRNSTPEETQRMREGATNGELWEWHTESGWVEVPISGAAGANGLELSDDGRTIYVAAWGSQSFFRLSRGRSMPSRTEIPLGFRIDNIHWARDGMLWGVGQAGPAGWKAIKIDPETLDVREVLTQADTEEFGAGTALVEVGDTLWVGSFRGNRIIVVPAP